MVRAIERGHLFISVYAVQGMSRDEPQTRFMEGATFWFNWFSMLVRCALTIGFSFLITVYNHSCSKSSCAAVAYICIFEYVRSLVYSSQYILFNRIIGFIIWYIFGQVLMSL